jgi:hypothetical protein
MRLHARLARLEAAVATRRSTRDRDAVVTALPPVEEFRELPFEHQMSLLLHYQRPEPDPPVALPPLGEFEQLAEEESQRLMDAAMGPPDPAIKACLDCLSTEELLRLYRETLHENRPARRSDR